MQRIIKRTPYLLLFSLLFYGAQAAATETYEPGPAPDRIILTISGDPATTQAITWRTARSVEGGAVEIAIADGSPDFRGTAGRHEATSTPLEADGVAAVYHTVELTGLTPSTLYAYRVGDESNWSEWFHFRTASDSAEPFSFIYFGDAQNDIKSLWSRVIRQAYSMMPEARFMLHAGDLINHSDSDAEWGEWHSGGGWLNGMLPSVATPGNHEYSARLSPQWRPQFAFPENGPDARGLAETVYYFDYQGVRFISLNTQKMGTPRAAQRQAEWLEGVLATNPHPWTIVTHHMPMFAAAQGRSGHPLANRYIRPLYESYGVDLVLQGHDHSYGRGDVALSRDVDGRPLRSGPVYVVSVSGRKMYEPGNPWWADVSGGNTQLYQLIAIDGDTLRYDAFTATGEPYDAFILRKGADGNSVLENVDLP